MKKHERKSCKSGSIKINSEDQRRVDTDRVVIGSENNGDRNRNLTLASQNLVVQNCSKWNSECSPSKMKTDQIWGPEPFKFKKT